MAPLHLNVHLCLTSDPENWQWVFGSVPIGPGFTYHNTTYQVTAQYHYRIVRTPPPPFPPLMQEYGPYQIPIAVNVRNLIVTSEDERKWLKWNTEHPNVCDTTISYSLQCAQKRGVKSSLEFKICPGTYPWTWNGKSFLHPGGIAQ